MRKVFYIALLISFLLNINIGFPQGLITSAKRQFIPGNKVIYENTFKTCPVGELPEGFDKINGAGECVRYKNKIWFAASVNSASLIKKADLGDDEFSVEFDLMFLKGNCSGVTLRFYSGKQPGKNRLHYDVRIGPGCSGEAVYAGMEPVGRVYKSSFKSLNRKIHITIQVRRKQIRFYLNKKRLTMMPFKGNVTSVGFFVSGKYKELISDIKLAKYSQKEIKPSPEKLGISVRNIQGGLKLTIPERILFDFNKFTLKPEAKQALEAVASIIKTNPVKKIIVTGYTDNIGSDAYNLKLSLQRAQSVADYLMYVEKLSPSLFLIKGKGKANPIASNVSKEGRAKNRRVEIELKK